MTMNGTMISTSRSCRAVSAAERQRAGTSCKRGIRTAICSVRSEKTQQTVFPTSYDSAVRQAQEATKAAVADGHKLIEVEIPSSGLTSVAGDGEGQNEMNLSMDYLRQYLNAWRDNAANVRVFFPDNKELEVARNGQTMDPAAGRVEFGPKFGSDSRFALAYLTKQNAAWAMLGVNLDKWSPAQLAKDTDEMFVVAYPSFNPREELAATEELYRGAAKAQGRPLVIFNGELDRIRGGYYPGLFFPGIAKLSTDFLPLFTTAYYIHNFKGTRPGALFRAYPGPWQVLRRNPMDPEETVCIWTGEQRPSLKEVALDILASNL